MSIPTLTKEEVFTTKDINYLTLERQFTGTDFDDKITQLNIDAVGYCKGVLIPTYYAYVEEATWRNLIMLYIRWQMDSSAYTQVGQELVSNFYIQLRDMLQSLNNNYTLQAQEKINPNYRPTLRVFN